MWAYLRYCWACSMCSAGNSFPKCQTSINSLKFPTCIFWAYAVFAHQRKWNPRNSVFEMWKHTKAGGDGKVYKGIRLRDRMENVPMNSEGGKKKSLLMLWKHGTEQAKSQRRKPGKVHFSALLLLPSDAAVAGRYSGRPVGRTPFSRQPPQRPGSSRRFTGRLTKRSEGLGARAALAAPLTLGSVRENTGFSPGQGGPAQREGVRGCQRLHPPGPEGSSDAFQVL